MTEEGFLERLSEELRPVLASIGPLFQLLMEAYDLNDEVPSGAYNLNTTLQCLVAISDLWDYEVVLEKEATK